MLERTISAVSMNNADFPSFEVKLTEAVRWVEYAAAEGSQLVVFPETINIYKGDGPSNPQAMTISDIAIRDWRAACAPLIDAAKRCNIGLVLPLFVHEDDYIINVAFFFDARGALIGQYRKMFPTDGEIDEGVRPYAEQPLIDWDGLRVGAAICFDTEFPQVFEGQVVAGAQLFIVPSYWPGGSQLDHYARYYGTPIVLAYPAWSRIIDMDGRELAAGGYRHETLRFGFGAPVYTATINFDRIALVADDTSKRIIEAQRAYGPKMRVTFDQPNCLFYLESRSDDVTAKQIAQEFGLRDRRSCVAASGVKRDKALRQTVGR
jgi:predicted amidohydrolase